jgi:hypothetical protein
MKIEKGHLFMADLTGYTAYLTASELEHAGPILSALLTTIIDRIQAPFEISNLEGDAVFFRGPDDGFVSGQTLLELAESIYFSFAEQRLQMIANTTCPCRACANIAGLDLKILAHHGSFQVLELAGRRELSGPDVILLHRMAKSAVKARTGIDSYLMLTKAAAGATGVDHHARHLTPYAETFEHFGEVETLVHDLAAAWTTFQAGREPIHISRDQAFWSGEIRVEGPAMVIWDHLILPAHKQVWMGMRSVEVEGGPGDRLGIGSDYHCVHAEADVRFRIIDWRPFDYFSALEVDPLGSGLRYQETWEIVPEGDAMIVRFSVAAPFASDPGVPASGPEVEAIKGLYEAYGMPMLEGLKGYLAQSR